MSRRLEGMGQSNYRNGFKLTTHDHMLERPIHWKRPQTVFVNSMSDLFHIDVPSSFIRQVFEVMNRADWHRFQVLTKRSDRLLKFHPELPWAENIWMGVSVENEDYVYRIDDLRDTDAHIKFLSIEPLLGRLPHLDLTGIDWVIVGGESGPKAREMKEDWVVEVRDQCLSAGVPFFFKQWGGVFKKRNGRRLQGATWDEMPESLPIAATA